VFFSSSSSSWKQSIYKLGTLGDLIRNISS
jgi:hypothetical protein